MESSLEWRTLQRAGANFSSRSRFNARELTPPPHFAFSGMTRRRLPHIYPDGRWLFATWHLFGSLPRTLYPPPGKRSAGKAFVWMDRYLDTTRIGPMFLRRSDVASLVVAALRRGLTLGAYDLRAFVVMGNHVHVLLLPLAEEYSKHPLL